MSFGENLRRVRLENNLSQEQLADMVGVSRQSVSKWEADGGYPETEKLLIIAKKLDTSLDFLLLDKPRETAPHLTAAVARNGILVKPALKETEMGYWDSFRISRLFLTKKKKPEPKYMLLGMRKGDGLFSCMTQSPLALYREQEDAEKELTEIYGAMQRGEDVYELKYYVEVESKKFSMYIEEIFNVR